jgi:hypothetical protein
MCGELFDPMAISLLFGLKVTLCPSHCTAVPGSVYLLQNPALRGYTWMRGALRLATAMSLLLNATHLPSHCTAVHGSLYFVQNQALRG